MTLSCVFWFLEYCKIMKLTLEASSFKFIDIALATFPFLLGLFAVPLRLILISKHYYDYFILYSKNIQRPNERT